MNIVIFTSQLEQHRHAKFFQLRNKNLFIAIGLLALTCFGFSPVWAADYSHSRSTSSSIHLTGLSIHVGPGGFRVGVGPPYYGRHYGRVHVWPAPRYYWKHPRHYHGRHHHFAKPHRFKHRHGWKSDRSRGHFRGKGGRGGGRGNGAYRGGGR